MLCVLLQHVGQALTLEVEKGLRARFMTSAQERGEIGFCLEVILDKNFILFSKIALFPSKSVGILLRVSTVPVPSNAFQSLRRHTAGLAGLAGRYVPHVSETISCNGGYSCTGPANRATF